MLEAFYASGGDLTAETVAVACAMPLEHAECWCRWVGVHLVSPGAYAPVFAAEDALADRRMQWQSYEEDCRATSARLAELKRQIEHAEAYKHSLVEGEERAQVQAKIAALDQERVDLLRHQGDLPGVGALIHQALEEAQAALSAAQEARTEAGRAQVQQVDARWLQDALALVEPLRRLLHEARTLDEAWERLGVKPNFEVGSGRLREAVGAALRR